MRVEIKEVDAAAVVELLAEMREVDRRELEVSNPKLSVEFVVELSVLSSDVCYAVYGGGRLFCLCGAGMQSMLSGKAVIWMIGTKAVEESPLVFLRNSRKLLGMIRAAMPRARVFVNAVWVRNVLAVRWLEWLGAWFTVEVMMGDELFQVFEFERESRSASAPAELKGGG